MKNKAQTRNYIVLIMFLFVILVGASLYFRIGHEVQQHKNLAIFFARSYFKAIVATRTWNAEHGGVYVAVRGDTQSNPYLEDPLRDVTTTGGVKLTKVNPAYMTRMISENLRREGDTQVHITSLKPIRPGNAPDAWETAMLGRFEKGESEGYDIFGKGESAVFRYMAPLKVEKSCLACHAKQGYREGDVRGGIRIAFSYEPFLKTGGASNRRSALHHAYTLLVGLILIGFTGRKLTIAIGRLEESINQIRRLEGLLPICSNCKKVRMEGASAAEQKNWVPIESYIRDRTNAEFSHGICPECYKKLYPGM